METEVLFRIMKLVLGDAEILFVIFYQTCGLYHWQKLHEGSKEYFGQLFMLCGFAMQGWWMDKELVGSVLCAATQSFSHMICCLVTD